MLPRNAFYAALLWGAAMVAHGAAPFSPHHIVIDGETLAHTPQRHLADVLDTVAGIQVTRFYGLGETQAATNHLGLGGAGMGQPLLLLNGRRLDIAQGRAALNSLPLASVERIEITPFLGAARYGQGTTGAVVNIITRTAKEDAAGLSLTGGSYHTREGSLWASTKRNDVGLFSAAEIKESRGYRENSRLRQHNGLIDVRYRLGASELYTTFHGSSEKQDIPGPVAHTERDNKHALYQQAREERDTFHLMPGVSWEFDQVQARVEGSLFNREEDGQRQPLERHQWKMKGYSLNPHLAGQWNTGEVAHAWEVGGELHQTTYENREQAPKARQRQLGAYGQWRSQVTPWMATTLAARQDALRQEDWQGNNTPKKHLHQYEGEVQFRLAAPLHLHLSAARQEQAAPLLLGQAPLAHTAKGSLYSGTLAWQHQGQRSALSYWYGEHHRGFYYDVAQNRFRQWQDKVRHKGFSLNSRWRLDEGLWLTLNATVQKTTFAEGTLKGKAVPNTPRRTGYAELNWRALPWLDVAFAQRYYGSRFYANDNTNAQPRQRGYNWSDITATVRWQQLAFTVGLYNLQDRRAYDVGLLDPQGDAWRYPLPGRHVMASISADF